MEIYSLRRVIEDPEDLVYTIGDGLIFVFAGVASAIFTLRFFVNDALVQDLGKLHDPKAMALGLLSLSWISTALALQAFVFTLVFQHRTAVTFQRNIKSSRVNVDLRQRPLPVKILEVKHCADPTIFVKGSIPARPEPTYKYMRTTYDCWYNNAV
ncbi:hypothetical protein C8Q75DRAFT_19014 [Abortiporus biennis]|nr:hypothetical protein C8Q75DRAFT_19014 [Abortiporus biennis]